MKRDITYNLELASPKFLFYIKNMDVELSKWIQYNGLVLVKDNIYFKFKSSQNSLNFEIYCGINVNGIYDLLMGQSDTIYNYFRELKYDNIASTRK